MSLSLLLNARPKTAPRSGAGPRLGSGKAQGWRAPFEFYPTPPAAIRALLSVERFDGPVWEPACGDGAIARELASAGYDVVATDIVDWGYGQPGLDFLETREPLARHIITNPPYGHGLADDFVQHALMLTRKSQGRVAMLLNIASLCHPARHERFVQHPPSVIYALDECVCYPLGDPARASTYTLAHRYAWVIWDHGHEGETAFRWISTAPFNATAQQKGEQQ
jgi:hypothetical protein